MKRVLTILLLLLLLLLPVISVVGQNQRKKIEVFTNTNIETLMICYELAETGGWNFPSNYCHTLNEVVRERFKAFRQHETIETMNMLLQKGFWLDRMVHVVLNSEPFPKAKTVYTLSEKNASLLSGNPKKAQQMIDEFVVQLSEFYRDAELHFFFTAYKDYYTSVNNEVRAHLPDDGFIEAMEGFYGKSATSYHLIPSPIMKVGSGFGPQIRNEKGMVVCNVFGPLIRTKDPEVFGHGYGSKYKILNITRHEFGHAFVNPATEMSQNKELIQQYAYLYEPIKSNMRELGYTTWWICVTEHIVRLGEVRLSNQMDTGTKTKKLRDHHVENKGFVYLPHLEECMLEYEHNRDQYPTFESFMPKLLRSFAFVDHEHTQEDDLWLLVFRYVLRSYLSWL